MSTSGTNILVVEDNTVQREAMAEFLEALSYRVSTATNGFEALAQLDGPDTDTDLILLDLSMPVMDGEEFLRRKSRSSEIAAIKVIVISGSERPPPEARSPSVEAFLKKPISPEVLLSTIERASAGTLN
jgi:CheY-like chemotaxis protein